MTWRRLAVLVRHLPRESALVSSVGGPGQWGWVEHLLAGVAHAVQMGNWQRGGGKGSKPKPIRPPGVDDRKTFGTAMDIDDMRRVLDTWSDDPALLGPDGKPMEVTDER